jgi:oligoribonuclease
VKKTRELNENNLVWIDMEMTGLDPEVNLVLEIATIVTNAQLDIVAEGPVIAIFQPEDVLESMDEWCTEVHNNTGLTARCLASSITVEQAAEQTIKFLMNWVPKGASPLCGNTIGQDRRFMVKYMPKLEAYFHYRNIDVSSIKELVSRWQPPILDGFVKKNKHLALDDIRESIEEMKYYRDHVFKI